MMDPLRLRDANPGDAGTIHDFICALALYEREPDAVETTPEALAQQLASEQPPFECVLAELGGQAVGFALFFYNYSTWKGRRGLYLEDLFVLPEFRGRGVGKALFLHVGKLAKQRGCARYEWAALDWNTPAIAFYKRFGAEPLSEWTTFRLSGAALESLA